MTTALVTTSPTDPIHLAPEAWVDSVFSELARMDVALDPDPLEYGTGRLVKKIAACRLHLSRTEMLFNDVAQRLQRTQRAKRRTDTTFQLKEADLLANDPDVRAGRNVRDRTALVLVRLTPLVEDIHELGAVIHDLEAVLTVVKSKRSDLRDIQRRIQDQVKLCQEAIGLGTARWGTKLPPGTPAVQMDPRPAPSAVATDPDDLGDLLEKTERHLGDYADDEGGKPDFDDLLRREVVNAGGDLDGLSDFDAESEVTDPKLEPEVVAGSLETHTSPEPLAPEVFAEAVAEAQRRPGHAVKLPDPAARTPRAAIKHLADLNKAGAAAIEHQADIVLDPEVEALVEAKIEQAEADIALVDDNISLDDFLAAEEGAPIPEPPVAPEPEPVVPAPDDQKTGMGKPLEEYPQVGFCDVCGEPSYQTPSGTTCGEHGGAGVVDKPYKKKKGPEEVGGQREPEGQVANLGDELAQEPPEVLDAALVASASDEEIDAFLATDPVGEHEAEVVAQRLELDDFLADL